MTFKVKKESKKRKENVCTTQRKNLNFKLTII